MAKPVLPDQALLRMPSFKAMRSFVAAARYRSFTQAADALCVTQAAISRQIRELELQLGSELFVRGGRELKLSAAGAALFDAAQVSFLNIFQATERIRREQTDPHSLTLCCSPALAALWLAPRLKALRAAHPGLDLQVITTQHAWDLEPGMEPDIFISKTLDLRPGYRRTRLFHEVVYPVCSPALLAAQPELGSLAGLRQAALLDLHPHGRAQLSEQVDWNVWFAFHGQGQQAPSRGAPPGLSSNDYPLLMQMALDGQGVALGWDHLVRHWLEQGRLVRPLREALTLSESVQYLIVREDKDHDPACRQVQAWLRAEFE
ncbi:LysR substrate-binding domain-containing protein [Pseudomonas sp. NPDC007930]|uniref:LysR substrate-binding domain-containing protein n=1 Tax=Pseudomonas sp. NPDC007930 TaxID=3364417 RepID=UPI0036EA438F